MEHIKSIKYAQIFELFGECLCLGGSITYMYHADNLSMLIGSGLLGLGNLSMIIQSVLTLQIAEKNNDSDTESV